MLLVINIPHRYPTTQQDENNILLRWINFYQHIPCFRIFLMLTYNNIFSNKASFPQSSFYPLFKWGNIQSSSVALISYYLLLEWPFLTLWLQPSAVPWMNIKFQCRFLYWILNSNIQYLIDISNALLLQIELIIFITVNTVVFPRLPFHW